MQQEMMGEEIVSMVSNGGTSIIEEVSDSNSSSDPSLASKHTRNGGNIFTSKLRGVVPQPNGHWGCQIYANHQRIWLGTFKSEKEAAMAYDSAALKLRNGDCRRNFPLTNMTVEEPNFQSHYSTEALLSMIKDGTYQSKLEDFVRTRSQKVEAEFSLKLNKTGSNRKLTCKQLFQKELTPSDVGKLNRLVIPKKYAVKFFSHMSKGVGENVGVNKVNDGQLAFYDKSMKLWKFRYCYWRSSQSYVFTRGWNRFVKEKQLKANDTIAICLCECSENSEVTQTYYMINVLNGENNSSNLLELSDKTGMQLQLELRRISSGCDNIERNKSLTAGMELRLSPPPKHIMEGKGLIMESKVRNVADRKSFRLFGTEII